MNIESLYRYLPVFLGCFFLICIVAFVSYLPMLRESAIRKKREFRGKKFCVITGDHEYLQIFAGDLFSVEITNDMKITIECPSRAKKIVVDKPFDESPRYRRTIHCGNAYTVFSERWIVTPNTKLWFISGNNNYTISVERHDLDELPN